MPAGSEWHDEDLVSTQPNGRPIDKKVRLRRLVPVAPGGRRPARPPARRPAHRRHPAAQRERPPAGGQEAARPGGRGRRARRRRLRVGPGRRQRPLSLVLPRSSAAARAVRTGRRPAGHQGRSRAGAVTPPHGHVSTGSSYETLAPGWSRSSSGPHARARFGAHVARRRRTHPDPGGPRRSRGDIAGLERRRHRARRPGHSGHSDPRHRARRRSPDALLLGWSPTGW
jgi:hypothetical protein